MLKKCFYSLFFFALLFSCKKEKTSSRPNLNDVEYELSLENEKAKNQSSVEHECIFDQSTQTDAFLKGLKELEDYTWNN